MLKIDKVRAKQHAIFIVIDYLWGGFMALGIVFALCALWQIGSVNFGEFLIPAPLDVGKKALEICSKFGENGLEISLFRALIGVSVSLIIGIGVGLIAGSYKSAMAFLSPLITILLATPPIIWIVLAVFWFSFGNPSVLFTIIVIVAPLTFASSAMAMASVEKAHEELFDAYKLGVFKKIRYLYIPHLLGRIISAISVAVASGAKVLVMSELLGANDGIGAKIADARAMLEASEVLAYVCLIIIFVALFEYLISKPLQLIFMPWIR